jgi:hypothetical protein
MTVVEMAGIEPATATLAGRARYLSCHPRGQASANLRRLALSMVLTLWTSQLSSPYEWAFTGRLIRPGVNENRPVGDFPWGGCRQVCLFALTRQPLPRSGQPEAATPGSCTRAAAAPGEWSCIQGKPSPRRGQSYFPARRHRRTDHCDATFMLFQRHGWDIHVVSAEPGRVADRDHGSRQHVGTQGHQGYGSGLEAAGGGRRAGEPGIGGCGDGPLNSRINRMSPGKDRTIT